MKRSIGMPWGFLLEFHGWWHILTAVGAYTFIAMVEKLTDDKGVSLEDSIAWPLGIVATGAFGSSMDGKEEARRA